MYSSLNYLLAALLGAAAPPSQTATPLTWDAAVARVTTANAELAAAQAELRASEYQEAVARSAFLPAVSANIGYDRSDGRALGTGIGAAAGTVGGDSYSATLNATQNIFAGGADAAKIERAQANTRLARARARAVAAKLSYELKTAFQGLVFAQAYERLTQEIVRRRSDNLRLVELRFDGGRENKGSVLLSQAYRQQALYDALQARNATRIARAQLAKLLRADTAVEYTVADSGVPIQAPAANTPDFPALANTSPDFIQAAARAEVADADVTVARAPMLPNLSVSGARGRYGDDFFPDGDERWSVGVNLSWSLFNGGRDYFGIRSAHAARYASSETRENVLRDTVARLEQAYASYLEAVAKLDMDASFHEAALVRAEIARRKYNNGLLSFEDWDLIENDLIARQKVILQSRRDRVSAEAAWEQVQGKGALNE